MKKILVSVFGLMLAGSQVIAQNWNIDKSHSKVSFTVTHMLISEVEGKFKIYDGKIASSKDDFTDAQISFTIDVNSIDTDEKKRDEHLKGDDFFNAEKYPTITFKGKQLKKVSGKNYKLTGDLTIRDVTKPVEFDVVFGGIMNDPWGNTKAGFKINGKVSRKEFGLKWNALLEGGGAVVSDEVAISCGLELAKAK